MHMIWKGFLAMHGVLPHSHNWVNRGNTPQGQDISPPAPKNGESNHAAAYQTEQHRLTSCLLGDARFEWESCKSNRKKKSNNQCMNLQRLIYMKRSQCDLKIGTMYNSISGARWGKLGFLFNSSQEQVFHSVIVWIWNIPCGLFSLNS